MRTNLASRILVGIDFSECSDRALLRAISRAEAEQAQLELLHVFEWNNSSAVSGSNGQDVSEAARSRLWREVTAQAQLCLQRLTQLCAAFVADRVPVGIRVLVGDPALGVLNTAAQISASLIVLGAIGRRPILRGTVGTTAERVCEKSTIPVLLVPYVERQEKRQGRVLFLSARDQALWSCAGCGMVQQPGESKSDCAFCGDNSAAWVSMPQPHVSFASLQ